MSVPCLNRHEGQDHGGLKMRKYLLLTVLLTLVSCLAFSCVLAENDDDDLEIEDIIESVVSENTPALFESDGSVIITVSCTGDFTIGGDSRKKKNIFEDELEAQGGDINFTMRNIRDLFLEDDLTLVNFEGTLTESTYVPANKKENQFLFSAPPSYVTMLSDNGVDAVSLENNHVMDHGEEVYEETKQTLRNAGIIYSNSTEMGVFEIPEKKVQIAMLSYLCIDRYEKPVDGYATLYDKVAADIQEAKRLYPIVIVSFHWGNELDYSPTNNQIRMGRLAVDSGADLVVGHHSHRINPIECYKGVYICYSLGNFCFSGNNKPSDMNSYIFQIRFRVTEEGKVSTRGFRIVPIRISSRTDRNNFVPTLVTKDTTIDAILTTLRENGKKLEYAVDEYPLTWE